MGRCKEKKEQVGRRVEVGEREFPGRMWHEWKVLLMSINDIRKVQPNMQREGTAETGCNGCGGSHKWRLWSDCNTAHRFLEIIN